jgi:hypothetical protein
MRAVGVRLDFHFVELVMRRKSVGFGACTEARTASRLFASSPTHNLRAECMISKLCALVRHEFYRVLSFLLIDFGWGRQLFTGVILRALLTDSQSHERAAKRDGAGVGSRGLIETPGSLYSR